MILHSRVMETSSTTGTGAIALGGAVAGYKTFASRYSVGSLIPYAIENTDANGNPSGEWETGIGTYSATDTLTRTTVHESSNGDAAVSFTAGTKRVFVSASARYLNADEINAQSGTSYTLALKDAGEIVELSNASAITLTVPPNSSVAFPIGTEIEVWQMGAGVVSVVGGSGVTVDSLEGALSLAGQYAGAVLRKRGTNLWLLGGALA